MKHPSSSILMGAVNQALENMFVRIIVGLAIAALLSAGCGAYPRKRIPGVTNTSEFSPSQIGLSFKSTDEDDQLYKFAPIERVEFHSSEGDTIFLYGWTVEGRAGALVPALEPRWEAEEFFVFKHDTYQSESGWLTVVPTDSNMYVTIDALTSKLGLPLFRFERAQTGKTGLELLESNTRAFLFRRSDGYLLVRADSQGRIVGTRQQTQGLRPSRALHYSVSDGIIPFWKSLQR